MDNMIYVLFISIFFPVFMMALLVEKKARLPVSFFLVGMFVSVLSSEVNGLLQIVLSKSVYETTIVITPVTEEILKALPVLFFAIVISDKRESLLTASMATGIGFAVLENGYYLLANPGFGVIDAVMRAFGAGLMHGMCTLLVGVGISFVKKMKKIFTVGTFALLSTAITYHSIYNMLVQSDYAIVGVLLPIITYIPFFIWRMLPAMKKEKE